MPNTRDNDPQRSDPPNEPGKRRDDPGFINKDPDPTADREDRGQGSAGTQGLSGDFGEDQVGGR